MATAGTDKRKAQTKAKLQERRQRTLQSGKFEKAEFFYWEALQSEDRGNLQKALRQMEKAVESRPKNEDYLIELCRLARILRRQDIEIRALLRLYETGKLRAEGIAELSRFMVDARHYNKALELIEAAFRLLPKLSERKRIKISKALLQQKLYCQAMTATRKNPVKAQTKAKDPPPRTFNLPKASPSKTDVVPPPPEIQLYVEVDSQPLYQAVTEGKLSSKDEYELALDGYGIRFSQAFENLICISRLEGVRSFWYQEETVRKVMKSFRGRALLADEVGLGKTIEALMILKEYILRGMVKSALILVPSPLVTQWRDELAAKFQLEFLSTEDADFRSGNVSTWNRPYVLASINVAKSKKNFPSVTEKEWDLVIVDEAHHLKNRTTLNWKLVNSLKKRFLLLLTATPVENNLMELHNLITLLKPGQLKTAAEFKKEFMVAGDPTDPRNKEGLKGLLGEIMVRNTRAIAKIGIPPRFARTLKIKSSDLEKALYEKVSCLVRTINRNDGVSKRLLLQNLLEEAGSSPRAVALSLSRLLDKKDELSPYEKDIRDAYDMCISIDDNSKHRILLNLIKKSREKLLVFVKYLGTLEHIAEFLKRQQIPHALFHGRMNSHDKEEQIRLFRDERPILVTTEIGGEGRNLQFCSQMINYDLPWNPMKIEQRIGRIHRIGQEKEVMIYNLCAEGSIEDRILYILDRKINMFEMVIGEIDMVLGRVTGEQDFSDMIYDIWVNSATEEKIEKGFSHLATRLKRAKTGYESTKALDEKLFGENYEL
ncbi:MAG: DEAD/DEAH box helicase family protein [Deltaproteobacteria bacterium]|nr:DEAD/DEAH box helicase family protein [Deltaproteobacteria bacterium]